MYCNNCGSEIDGDALFCSECGRPITTEYRKKPSTGAASKGKYRRKRKSPAKTIVTVLALVVACIGIVVFISFLVSDPEVDAAVETVQNGYLGEFTDLTVKELFDYSYGMYFEESEWDGGTTDEGKLIVEVKYYNQLEDECRIQFTMLDDQCFKLNYFSYPDIDNSVPTEVWNQLTSMYLDAHNAKHNNNMDVRGELIKRLDETPCNASVMVHRLIIREIVDCSVKNMEVNLRISVR